ncbi:MAG: hypothetical protein ACR2RB_22280 [Gammaproteobacteria bacterium]
MEILAWLVQGLFYLSALAALGWYIRQGIGELMSSTLAESGRDASYVLLVEGILDVVLGIAVVFFSGGAFWGLLVAAVLISRAAVVLLDIYRRP